MSIDLADGLDRCVRCGLCLPHCPTFELTGDEAESPRGRVVLIQAMLDGTLRSDASTRDHLDSCLHCRRCETACPAEVEFGALMDGAQALLRRRGSNAEGWVSRGLRAVTRRHWAMAFAMRAARHLTWLFPTHDRAGVSRLGRAWNLARFARERARPSPAPDTSTSRPGGTRVALFTGCLDPWMHPRAVEDAAWVIERLGHQLVIPDGQGCCGALHQHAGDQACADALRATNHAVFEQIAADHIVFLSTGCGMTLAEGEPQMTTEPLELCAWIERVFADEPPRLAPVEGRISVHQPCSAKFAGTGSDAAQRLLSRIPRLDVQALQRSPGCCGAAGSYMIDHGAHADRLGRAIVAALGPDSTPVTPNLGCALQIATHSGRREPALHPVSVLRVALDGGGSIG
jgi:glycolate dehydrogenase iron-sulfur subunit